MKHKLTITIGALLLALLLLTAYDKPAQAQSGAINNPHPARKDNAVQLTGSASTVTGSGTPGQLPKWLGSTPSSFVLGDSTITEDKFGRIGIGTTAPTSKLTVQGMIETTLGGLKFPDGTVQTTAASGLQSVFHNATLAGNGTQGAPLGLAVPLSLSGSGEVFTASSTNSTGITAQGGVSLSGFGADGIRSKGGTGTQGRGGAGVLGVGGNSTSASSGGDGIFALGGQGSSGGIGVNAAGADAGDVSNGSAGDGVLARGGKGSANVIFSAGAGLIATGGDATGMGNVGGDGISTLGGNGSGGAGGAGIAAFPGPGGLAGRFSGDVVISGNVSKGGGSFKIDHPLDPENKYLYHSFVESPDMMNIYNGNVTTDENGDAVVTLPVYFEALNRDFRYQLTVIGQFAQAMVASKLKDNRFAIKTNAPQVEVSWQVTGIRQDAYANKHRIPVEVDKAELERGTYLHPDAFDQPEEKSVEWVLHPKLMRQAQEMRKQSKPKPMSDQ